MRIPTLLALLGLSILTLAAAREDPKSLKPDDEGYVRDWLVTEPVKLSEDVSSHSEEQEKPVFDKAWVRDEHRPKAGDKLKAGDKQYAWTAQRSPDALVQLDELFGEKDHDQCLFLGVVYVQSPKDLDGVKLSIGSDDSSVWRVNGREVIRVYAGRDLEKDTDKSNPLSLKKGTNVVEVALIQGDGPTGWVARFVDKNDKPVKDLTVSLEPPAK